MYRTCRAESHLGAHYDIDQFRVAVLLHQRYDTSNGVDVNFHFGHFLCAVCPQVIVYGALYHSVQKHFALHRARFLRPLQGLFGGPSGFLLGPFGLCEYIEHRPDVGPDALLEFYYLRVGEIDLSVHVALERPRVGHDDAVEIQHLVEAFRLRPILQFWRVLDDVGVRYQRPEAEFVVQLPGRHRVDLGVDHRQKRRSLNGTGRCLEAAYPRKTVSFQKLEACHLLTLSCLWRRLRMLSIWRSSSGRRVCPQ